MVTNEEEVLEGDHLPLIFVRETNRWTVVIVNLAGNCDVFSRNYEEIQYFLPMFRLKMRPNKECWMPRKTQTTTSGLLAWQTCSLGSTEERTFCGFWKTTLAGPQCMLMADHGKLREKVTKKMTHNGKIRKLSTGIMLANPMNFTIYNLCLGYNYVTNIMW